MLPPLFKSLILQTFPKGDENDWGVQLLNAGLHWADLHGLSEHYRTRFEGITPVDVQPQRAEAENRLPSFPIWQIANELVVGCYLERVVGWTYGRHEPDGRQGHCGEWQFTTPSGRDVFVEVKSMSEPDWSQASGVFSRPDYRNRITKPLAEAYKQLADDGRATLVVLVAEFKLSISHGIIHGDLYQALFGEFRITFPVGADFSPEKMRAGPSFRDTFVHHTKHRRLGCVMGLVVRGLLEPSPLFYAIQNPYAHSHVRLANGDIERMRRFTWTEDGHGNESAGLRSEEVWRLMNGEQS